MSLLPLYARAAGAVHINITAWCSAARRDDGGLSMAVPTMVTKAPKEGAGTHTFLLHSADIATHLFTIASYLHGVYAGFPEQCHVPPAAAQAQGVPLPAVVETASAGESRKRDNQCLNKRLHCPAWA